MLRFGANKLVLTRFVLPLIIAGAGWVQDGMAKGWASDGVAQNGSSSVALSDLPPQGRDTYGRILAGGPFPYEKDGVVFGNRERLLEQKTRGYYREYTVKSPGARDRGARRIVCGGQAQRPDACYYSDDHYASFRKIAP
jgi:ribonuclease T1